MRIILIIIALLSLSFHSIGQSVRVGEPFPVSLQTKDMQTLLRQSIGKPMILDLFSSTCTVCFEAMPKMQKLQKKFASELKMILVGYEDGKVQKVYERLSRHYQFDFTVIFDSVLPPQTGSNVFPMCIWIDRSGIVKGITTSSEVNDATILRFLQTGISPNTAGVEAEVSSTADAIDTDNSTLFFSTVRRSPVNGKSYTVRKSKNFPDTLVFRSATPQHLYRFAFTGKSYWAENDSNYSRFFYLPLADKNDSLVPFNLSGEFDYTMALPAGYSDSEKLKYMQQDLDRAFGYKSRNEDRIVPYWSLTVINNDTAKLKAKKNIKVDFLANPTSFRGSSIRTTELIKYLLYYHRRYGPIFLDETGIKGLIDIELNAVAYDIKSLQTELRRLGLSLEQKQLKMKVIVIYTR